MLLSSISFSVSHTTVHCPCQWYFMGGDSAWDHINCCPRHSANWFTAHEHVLQALERATVVPIWKSAIYEWLARPIC